MNLLEIATYRFEGFTVADASKFRYRSRLEVEQRQQSHDPLKLWDAQWLSEKGVDQNCLKQMRADALAEAKDAAAYAMTSGLPEPAAIMNDIYWAVDCATSSTPCDQDHFTTPSTSSS